jgi:hypothetical protein
MKWARHKSCAIYGNRKSIYRVVVGDLMERHRLEDLLAGGRITLTWIFKEWVGEEWAVLIWIRIETDGGCLQLGGGGGRGFIDTPTSFTGRSMMYGVGCLDGFSFCVSNSPRESQ